MRITLSIIAMLFMGLHQGVRCGDIESIISFGPEQELKDEFSKKLQSRCPSFTTEECGIASAMLARRFSNKYVMESSFWKHPFSAYVPDRLSQTHFNEEFSLQDIQHKMRVIKRYGDLMRSAFYTCGIVSTVIRIGPKKYKAAEKLTP